MTNSSYILFFSNGYAFWIGSSRFALLSGDYLKKSSNAVKSGRKPLRVSRDLVVRVITKQPSQFVYTDAYVVMRESLQARAGAFVYRSWMRHIAKIARLDAIIFRIKEGEMFPKYTFTGFSSCFLFDRFRRS